MGGGVVLPEYTPRLLDLAHDFVFSATGSLRTANALAPRIANGWIGLAEAHVQTAELSHNVGRVSLLRAARDNRGGGNES